MVLLGSAEGGAIQSSENDAPVLEERLDKLLQGPEVNKRTPRFDSAADANDLMRYLNTEKEADRVVSPEEAPTGVSWEETQAAPYRRKHTKEAQRQVLDHRLNKVFERTDTNKDGIVSRDELSKALKRDLELCQTLQICPEFRATGLPDKKNSIVVGRQVEKLEPGWGLLDSVEHGLFQLPGAKESPKKAQAMLEDMFTKNSKISNEDFRRFCAKVKRWREKELAEEDVPVDLDAIVRGRSTHHQVKSVDEVKEESAAKSTTLRNQMSMTKKKKEMTKTVQAETKVDTASASLGPQSVRHNRRTDRIMARLAAESEDEEDLIMSEADLMMQRDVDEALFTYESMVHLRQHTVMYRSR